MGKQDGTSAMVMNNVLEATKIQTFVPLLLLTWLESVILLKAQSASLKTKYIITNQLLLVWFVGGGVGSVGDVGDMGR